MAPPTSRLRSTLVLLLTTVSVGVATALVIGALVTLLALALRSIGGSGP